MLKIFVPENYENNNLVDIYSTEDNKTTTREMDINELYSWIEDSETNKEITIEIEYKLTVNQITLEEYDGEYDVILNKYTYMTDEENGLEYNYNDEHLKTYKNRKSAEKFATEQTKKVNTLRVIKEV